jgi:hypothetical protein
MDLTRKTTMEKQFLRKPTLTDFTKTNTVDFFQHAVSSWIMEDIAHKIDIRDIGLLKARLSDIGLELSISLREKSK